ncbi:ABC transporter permease [Massilia sp. Root133]|uniref:FtsX-like permease family protein n=1 Tax=Massilia cellulosiltytica TaxID=2683234 RepID=A0A7X3K9P5_9BURK|nr:MULTISPECIES: ABC transporter permease [Telluria group]KQX95542.1 ABC transporter permease [Massilia sp. Root133]MVW62762.1 FtsX-like permease family protein [Telluria cellulosilytica]
MLRNYLLTAYKVFMRRKLFTAINLACIVLTLVVLMVISALLDTAFWPTGVEGRSDRLLQVYGMRSESVNDKGLPTGLRTGLLGYKTISRYLMPLTSVERVSAITTTSEVSVYQGDRVSRLDMRRVDANYWKIMQFKLLAGRLPDEDDDRLGRMVAVVNATTARQLFPGAAAVGQRISVNGQAFEIIGVVADVIHINAYADIWAPLSTFPSSNYRDEYTGMFAALLLARSPADLPRVRADVERVAKTIQPVGDQIFGKTTFWADTKLDVVARALQGRESHVDSGGNRLLAMIAGGMLVFMLLPALNLVNLNMGRIMERSAEIGVRKAFGATSLQLAGQLVVENVLLCLAGGLLGLACAQGVLWWLEASQLIPYLEVHINPTVFGCGMLLAFVFGLLSGAIPAWKMSRLDPVHALKGAA